ncbi:MAG: ATP-grasp domain-containing protein [Planctomycetota bacterium]|nr:ATP-grasp domain-containing protein [Planctomycetota bacterium]
MHVIFVEPRFPAYQQEFVRALKEVGAYVTGIGESPVEALGSRLSGWLDAYEQVPSVCHEGVMLETVRKIQARGWVDRMEATIEAHILPAATVREATGIPGTSVRSAFLCRDKPAMKDALREAGVSTAASTGADTREEAHAFAQRVGYPLIVKPRGAAGAAGTYRVTDTASLDSALAEAGVGRGGSVAVEEFIEGHEAFYDTLSIGGTVAHEFITHYYPGVLEAMRTRWITPYLITTNRVDAPGYDEVRQMGAQVLEALGLGTTATHMEWFIGPKGLKFSEIGCRPPGVGAWDLYCAANDMDLYRDWASAVCHREVTQRPSRRYSAALVNLRPDRDGRIVGYEGLDAFRQRHGEWIIDSHIPMPGTSTMPVDAGYMANAWMRLRHPDYDTLRAICDELGQTVQVRAH